MSKTSTKSAVVVFVLAALSLSAFVAGCNGDKPADTTSGAQTGAVQPGKMPSNPADAAAAQQAKQQYDAQARGAKRPQ